MRHLVQTRNALSPSPLPFPVVPLIIVLGGGGGGGGGRSINLSHASIFTETDDDVPHGVDLLLGSTVVERTFEVAFQLGIDLCVFLRGERASGQL